MGLFKWAAFWTLNGSTIGMNISSPLSQCYKQSKVQQVEDLRRSHKYPEPLPILQTAWKAGSISFVEVALGCHEFYGLSTIWLSKTDSMFSSLAVGTAMYWVFVFLHMITWFLSHYVHMNVVLYAATLAGTLRCLVVCLSAKVSRGTIRTFPSSIILYKIRCFNQSVKLNISTCQRWRVICAEAIPVARAVKILVWDGFLVRSAFWMKSTETQQAFLHSVCFCTNFSPCMIMNQRWREFLPVSVFKFFENHMDVATSDLCLPFFQPFPALCHSRDCLFTIALTRSWNIWRRAPYEE